VLRESSENLAGARSLPSHTGESGTGESGPAGAWRAQPSGSGKRAARTTDLAQLLARLRETAESTGGKAQISACIEGSLSARLIGAQQRQVIQQAYEAVHAARVEGVQSDLETSVSGYTPLAPTYILTDGRRMNLQVAVHYDAYHRRTDVLVGTPIILSTY
ncbi:MAG: YwmB family TATA-box binding protein, partial [Alicyclobacillus shizuokensis]|nr:YwmB family TATA-box binding protein [Alicyclobacillus shizuokensis]